MPDMNALRAANAFRWNNAKITRDFSDIAKRLRAAKGRYQAVEAKTGVPWFVIAVIHMRESSQNWNSSLAQGDPWSRVSTHVPKGRGPFDSWEAAAIDALANCHPFLARQKDWSVGGLLTALEAYNGVGYANRGKSSPYLWAGTNQYSAGKFVADGVYDPSHVDTQPGCAGMILAMKQIDPSISFGAQPAVQIPTAEKPAVSTATKATTAGAGTVVAGAGAAATNAGLSAPEILAIITGVSLLIGGAILIGYRFMKGTWPWTGSQSLELSLPSHQSSAPSLEQVSAALSAVSSAASPVTPLPASSASSRRRKQSAKPSSKTRKRRTKSATSKKPAVKKSAPKRKSKSKR